MTSTPLNWYHLADSAFPTGGFAFSSGLEAAAKIGLFRSRNDFFQYLQCSIRQLASYDIPFVNSCFTEADTEQILEYYHAGITTPTMMRASLIQGRSLIRSLEQILGEGALKETCQRLPRNPDRRHWLLVFGWGLSEVGMELSEATRCLLYITVRDAISSAVRLGSIGPMEGHQMQHDLLQEGERLLERSQGSGYETARRLAPSLEISQAWHGHIYSKLFQS